MKKINTFILLFFYIICYNTVFAQQENVWAFGSYAGIDFSSGTPVALQTAISDWSSAYGSVCNSSGQLLFYTDGDTVYNKNGQIMPNGSGLTNLPYNTNSPTGLITQGVLIVPMPDSADKYYVFSTTSDDYSSFDGNTDTLLFGRLYYSIVDMSLNGGVGDVEQGHKSILLDSNIVAGITGIPGSDCNIWLLYRTLPHLQFKAYSISSAGIGSSPVLSGGAFSDTFSTYNMPNAYTAVAPNHQKIASAPLIWNFGPLGASGYLQLFDFDSTTGVVSNNISIDFNNSDPVDDIAKAVCFSPDNSKLYSTTRFNTSVNQYDLSSNDSATIANSQTVIGACDLGSELQIGPDGKIYFMTDASDMGNIGSPNLASGACGYNASAVQALSGTAFANANVDGLPNVVPIVRRDTVFAAVDTSFGPGSAIAAPQGYSYILWNDGSANAQKAITASGTYWVYYYNAYCQQHVDTFHVDVYNEGIPAVANTAMSVYPNPAQSEITVTINSTGKISGTINIVNVLGQVVLQQVCVQNNQALNVSNLENGTYIVSYTDKDDNTPRLRAHILVCR